MPTTPPARHGTRHWPVIERHGAHLDIVTRASSICDDMLELA